MRIALGLEYDGSGYCGWQTQAGGGAVQDVLESALAEVAGRPVAVVAAGRTDAGVHASAQVVHFDSPVLRPETAWVRGVNTHLPESVAVRWACEIAPEFHARFGALGRRYTYLLCNRPVRNALWAGRAGWYHRPLDESAMQEAATYWLGEHDFSAFRAAGCQAKTPVRRLDRAGVVRRGDWLVFTFHANAFLHHMVRNLVGTLIHVGKGKHTPSWAKDVLASRDRCQAAPTFMPDGLYLSGVDYDAGWRLPPHGDTIAPFL